MIFSPKFLKQLENWLEKHPEKEWIIKRYLKNLRNYTNEALLRLAGDKLFEEEQLKTERKKSI